MKKIVYDKPRKGGTQIDLEHAEGRGKINTYYVGVPPNYGSSTAGDMKMVPASHSHTTTRIAQTYDRPNEFERARGATRVWNKVRPKAPGRR